MGRRRPAAALLVGQLWLAGCVGGPTRGANEPTARPEPVSTPAEEERAKATSPGASLGYGLRADTIRNGVMAHMDEFQRCFSTAHARDPNLSGQVVVAFVISPVGRVDHATVVNESQVSELGGGPREFTTLTDPEVLDCVLGVYRQMTFPSADKPTNVSFPLQLRRREGSIRP